MAMIAGGAGKGILGAWPAAEDRQRPRDERAISGTGAHLRVRRLLGRRCRFCLQTRLAITSRRSTWRSPRRSRPAPTRRRTSQTWSAAWRRDNVAVVAAAGNNPGAVEEPGAEPDVFAVGADTAQPGTFSDTGTGAVCSFTANQGVGLYAPGCGLDGADPFSDQPYCCEDGTSQASAFTAAVIVAMMSYDPTLSYSKAEQLLTQTAKGGDLDVAAAFQADGLGQIVSRRQREHPRHPGTASTAPTTSDDRLRRRPERSTPSPHQRRATSHGPVSALAPTGS